MAYQSSLSHADVIAVPLDGGPIRTLLGSMRTEQEPAASPVAPQVVYVTNKRSRSEIWIKDLAQGWDRPLLSPRDVRVRGKKRGCCWRPCSLPMAAGSLSRRARQRVGHLHDPRRWRLAGSREGRRRNGGEFPDVVPRR